MNYQSIKKDYPETISLEQLRIILQCAKRSAAYLLENQIIPCTVRETSKTWKYTIQTDDVIEYMKKRETYGSMIPVGAVASGRKESDRKKILRRSAFRNIVNQENLPLFEIYFEALFSYFPDVLNKKQIAMIIGLSEDTVQRLIRKKLIRKLPYSNEIRVPKTYLMEYIISPEYINSQSNSQAYIRRVRNFKRWEKAHQRKLRKVK